MGTWKTYKLGDVADVVGGGTPKTSKAIYWDGDVPWITPKDLSKFSGRWITRGERNISALGLANSGAVLLPKGTVLVSSRAPVGYVALAGCELCTNQGFKSLVPHEGYCPAFLYYLLKYNTASLKCVAKGSTFPELSALVISEIEFAFPPLEEQERIAGVLGAYDDLIAVNERRMALLEEAAHRLYRDRFVTHADPTWERKPIGEVVKFVRGRSYTSTELEEPTSDKGILFINLKNLRPFGGYQRGEEKRFLGKWREDQCVGQGDILMGVTDMTPERRLVGHVARVPRFKERAIFSMDLAKIEPVTCEREFLFEFLSQPQYGKLFSAFANGATVSHLRPDTLLDEPVLMPPLGAQRDYGRAVQPLYKAMDVLAEQNALLRAGRDKLLPRLLREEA